MMKLGKSTENWQSALRLRNLLHMQAIGEHICMQHRVDKYRRLSDILLSVLNRRFSSWKPGVSSFQIDFCVWEASLAQTRHKCLP